MSTEKRAQIEVQLVGGRFDGQEMTLSALPPKIQVPVALKVELVPSNDDVARQGPRTEYEEYLRDPKRPTRYVWSKLRR